MRRHHRYASLSVLSNTTSHAICPLQLRRRELEFTHKDDHVRRADLRGDIEFLGLEVSLAHLTFPKMKLFVRFLNTDACTDCS